ncbi:hypothetical protein NQ318_021234 [Aromia moschata]|uniref:DUF4817 domain-containing protein n=1 Tax=Aromia moschata TaxID=1265417 RepID=A0AAV8Y1C7_9CUCU|nr:hypothetical protein NQ318_021234 [Aromia moschata]
MSYLTESLKIEILMMIAYGDRARTQCEVVRLFRETHPDLPPLNQGTISKIEAQYREMGHVRKVPSKRQAVVDDDTKLNLLLALEENPITLARQLARDSNLNHKTVLKILKYEKKRPYKMQSVQELLEDDPDRRVEFCDLLMTCIDQNKLSLEWIVFPDEATFTLNGHVNRCPLYCRYWAEENPHWMRELHTQRPQKTNVWAGIIQDRIVGTFFFDDTLNGARYLRLLQHELMPEFDALCKAEVAFFITRTLINVSKRLFCIASLVGQSLEITRRAYLEITREVLEFRRKAGLKCSMICGVYNGKTCENVTQLTLDESDEDDLDLPLDICLSTEEEFDELKETDI